MRGVRVGWAVIAVIGAGSAGCQTLTDVDPGVCGNGVVEPRVGEDCDQTDSTTSKNACGQKGDDHECRWICDPAAGIACPDGWRCGVNKLCSMPVSPAAWDAAVDIPGASADSILVGDLDGDGISDAVTVADPLVDVTYFESTGAATPGDELVASGASPALGALAPGELPSLTLGVSRGLGVFTPTEDRYLYPATYASVSISIPNIRLMPFLSYDPNKPGLPVNPTAFVAYGDGVLLSFINNQSAAMLGIAGEGNLVGDAVAGRYDLYRSCEEVALAFDEPLKGGHVAIFAPCDMNGDAGVSNVHEITLPPQPPGMPPLGLCHDCQPIHSFDVDGNGKKDLIIIGSDNQAYIAYGDGNGNFASTPTVTPPDFQTSHGYTIPGPAAEPPLAVADLNHDCGLDFVLRTGLYTSYGLPGQTCAGGGAQSPKGWYTSSGQEDPHDWTEAHVADLNRDGLLDVVASSSRRRGISVYIGTGTPLFNPFDIVTDQPTKGVAVGDFDGDLLDDIAFAGIGQGSDTVYVAFGASDGAIAVPEAVGDVGVVEQIFPALEQVTYPDLIDDLFVIAQNADEKSKHNAFIFPGNSNRQIVAPYFLVAFAFDLTNPNQGVFDVPRRSIVGSFSGDPDHRDVAVFSSPLGGTAGGTSSLWLLPTGTDASIVPVGSTSAGAPEAVGLPGTLSAVTDALLANLGPRDGASADEILVVAPAPLSAVSGSTLLSAAAVEGGAFASPSGPDELTGFSISDGTSINGQMITAHVRDAGALDVVLASPSDGLALVRWDAASGALDVAGAARVSADDFTAAGCGYHKSGPGMRETAAVVALTADGGRQPILAVISGTGYRVDWDSGAAKVTCFPELDGKRAVAAGDFNGDGIEDILASSPTGLAVHFGKALAAGDAALVGSAQ